MRRRSLAVLHLLPALLATLGLALLGSGGGLLLRAYTAGRPDGTLTAAATLDARARCRRGTPPAIAQACLDHLARVEAQHARRGLAHLAAGGALLLGAGLMWRAQRSGRSGRSGRRKPATAAQRTDSGRAPV